MTNDVTPTRQAIAAKERSGKLTVSGKLKVAMDLMLEGSRRDDAAKAAGMTPHGLREALKKAHVRAYWNRGLQVLRESERARNILALADVRDKSENAMARVASVKALEQLVDADDGSRGSEASVTPGLTIVIRHVLPEPPVREVIDITPNKSNTSD
jgi:hypothetical protein